MSADTANAAYDMIDRYLRNNLDDDDYADYSAALELVSTAPEGYVLVPVEPLQELLKDYVRATYNRLFQTPPWEKRIRESIAAAQVDTPKTT